jgi:hypothetical protein
MDVLNFEISFIECSFVPMSKIMYNVTISVDKDTEIEWLSWMNSTHLPDVMATGMFLEYRMLKLIEPSTDEGATYAIQYIAKNMETYELYKTKFAPGLQAQTIARFGNKFSAFRTVLQIETEGK